MPSRDSSPTCGPCSPARATARFSRMTGVSWMRRSTSYQLTTAAQLVSSQESASAWQAAMAAWVAYKSGWVGVRRRASPSGTCPLESSSVPLGAVLIREKSNLASFVQTSRTARAL